MNADKRLSEHEFIALIATLFATIAFSIDAMLPALPRIAAELSPQNPNAAQLILTSFVLGMGIGTFFAGPLSDSFGRKPMILFGAILYSIAAMAAWAAPTLETVLAARLVQGIGAAGPRVVTLALVRDLYKGREMAKIVSFAMMIFTIVPAVAPFVGELIMARSEWRSIFIAFVIFSAVSILWMGLRQPETMPPNLRRPLQAAPLFAALREVLSHPVILRSIAVQTLAFACLFSTLSATQPIFDVTFDRSESFPMWFAITAILAGTGSFVNAALVMRLGMRRLITVTLGVQMIVSSVLALAMAFNIFSISVAFAAYLIWNIGVFFMVGLTIGNLNALALEPVGHIAGMAASVTGAIATVASVALAAPVGLMFNGTTVPAMTGVAVFAAAGYWLMRGMTANTER